MNPLRKLLGQTAVYGLSSILGRTLNYLLVPLYTWFFKEPSDYGVVSQLYAFVAFLMVLLTFGMETTYFRFIQDSEDRQRIFRNSFLTVILLNIVFFFGMFFFNRGIADLLLFSDHPEYIILMCAIVVIDAISSLPLAKLRAEEKAKEFAVIQFSSIGVNILLNFILLFFFFDAEEPSKGVIYILVANLLSSLVKPVMLRKDFSQISLKIDPVLLKQMLVYAIPIVIAGFAGIINETIDRIMLKQMLYDPANGFTAKMADAEIGIYSACYKLAMLVTILLQAYRYAAEPFFFNQMKNQDRNKLYVKLMNYFVAMVCVVFLGVSLNLDIFKYFISTKAYWEGLHVVPVLLLANVFLGIYFNQSIWYKLTNQTKYGAYISIMGAFLTIGINYLFIPKYGFVASAWATLIVYAFQMTVSYFWGQKHFPIKYNLRKFFLYLGMSILIYYVSTKIPYGDHGIIKFFLNNAMILLFIYIVLSVEGIKLSALRRK
ncbi:Polysaccharide biosynthesis protein [compost metagenome]